MRKIQYLVIHCTATPPKVMVTSRAIRVWHLSPINKGGRGWKQVGYSDMIHFNGRLENLVPYNNDSIVQPWEVTNGAAGINSISRHVVYVGGLDARHNPADTRTKHQLKTMESYVKDFLTLNPDAKVIGHNQVANKACPSFDVPLWLRSIGVDEKNIVDGQIR
jgi:N-acetylmuramoyl-L-alanine amidase